MACRRSSGRTSICVSEMDRIWIDPDNQKAVRARARARPQEENEREIRHNDQGVVSEPGEQFAQTFFERFGFVS